MKHLFTSIFTFLFSISLLHSQVFYEDFEGTAPGWVQFDNGVGLNENWVLINDGYNSDWAAHVQYEVTGGPLAQDWLVSPLITPTPGNTTLSFFQKQTYTYNWGSVYTIRISTTSQSNPAAFTTIFTQNETNFTTSYTLRTVDLSAYVNTPIYIAFVMTQNDGDDWYVDDVRVGPPPCFQPTGVSVYGQTTTSANFSWTENNGATQWEVVAIAANGSITPADILSSPFNPVMITGLQPGTAYHFYVRSVCGGGSRSAWTGPIYFETNCINPFNAPYRQFFNGNVIAPCWTQSGSEPWNFSTAADYAAAAAGDRTGNGGNYAWIDGSAPNGPAQISTLTSPRVNLTPLTRPALYYSVFSHNALQTGYNTLQVQFYNGTVWQTINTIQQDLGNGWKDYIVNLRNYTITGPVQVRFTVTENAPSGPFYNDILVDNVEFKEGLGCYPPENLSVSGITSTSAQIAWTAGDWASTQWEVEVVPAGTPPTGSGTLTGSNPFTVTGLSIATDYEVYVRERCGAGGNSVWVGPLAFTTLCGVYTAPYLQTFDGLSIPRCWSMSGDNPWFFNTFADYGASAAGDHTGNGGNYAWLDGSINENGEVSTLTTPLVNISPLTNPALRYFVFSNNTNNGVLNTLTVEFYDGAAWHTVQTIQNNLGNQWLEVIINLSGYTVSGPVRARFSVTGASAFGTWYHDILIDDVQFYNGPPCSAPIALNAVNLSTASADLTWGGGGAAWQLQWSQANQPLGGMPEAVNALPYSLSGLEAGTPYHYRVRRVCGINDTSAWSAPFVFNTDCPSPLPGNSLATAIVVAGNNFTDHRNTSRCYTHSAAGPSPDVWYRIELSPCTDTLEISLCDSHFDTYAYLYASDGATLLHLNDDYCGTRSYIKDTVTPGAVLYLLVEGFALETGEFELEIRQLSGVSAEFAYNAPSLCADAPNPMPTITGNGGGSFSSSVSGIALNAGSGEVNLGATAAGSYPVVYTVVQGACTQRDTFVLNVDAVEDASFAYAAAYYCQNATNPLPNISGVQGGTFSGSSGLVVNSTTGLIDVSISSINTHTVTYTTGGTCPGSADFTVEIAAVPGANHSISTQNIESCNGFGTVSSRIAILGEDHDGYHITVQWFDMANTPQGAPQTLVLPDNDNNPLTPLVFSKDTTVGQSGYFRFEVGVVRCGLPGAVQSINSYIYAAQPGYLPMNNAQADCYLYNRNDWVDFYDNALGEPVLSVRDGNGDSDSLKATTAYVSIDATIQDCNGWGWGIRPRLERHWQITPQNNVGARVRLYFDRSELDNLAAHIGLGSLSPTDLNLWKFRDGHLCTETPEVVPFTVIDMTLPPNDKAFVDASAVWGIEFSVASFSHFVLVPNASLLALRLLEFEARAEGVAAVRLDWRTEELHEYRSFEVLRSPDGLTFETLGTVLAQAEQAHYEYRDGQPLPGTSYYMLRCTDWSGEEELSPRRAVSLGEPGIFELFPNPAGNSLNVRCLSSQAGAARAEIIDALGRVLVERRLEQVPGIQTHHLQLELPAGVYTLHWWSAEGGLRSRLFVVER